MSELEKLNRKLTRYLGDTSLRIRYERSIYSYNVISLDEFLSNEDEDEDENENNVQYELPSCSMFSFFVEALLNGYFYIDDGNNYPYKIPFDSALEMVEIDFRESKSDQELLDEGCISLDLFPTQYGVDVLTEQDSLEIMNISWDRLTTTTNTATWTCHNFNKVPTIRIAFFNHFHYNISI